MKKLLIVMLALLLTLGMTCAAAEDEVTVYTSGDWKYVLLEDGTAEITKYTGKAIDLNIPSTIDGFPIFSIGTTAFYYCKTLKSISIPDGITSIGDNAFQSCKSLKNINIPDSVTTIGHDAFAFCEALKTITIPDSVVSISSNPFFGCKKLTTISISDQHPVLAIVDGVLFDTVMNRLICYPNALRSDTYVIPYGTRIIGEHAFHGCDSLTSVVIPDTVTDIEANAFFGCNALQAITMADSIITIGNNAFNGCDTLSSITIPESVTTIGDYAFSGCYALTTLVIPNSVVTVGASPFQICSQLNELVVSPEHPVLAIIDGMLIDKSDNRLISFVYGADRYAIPQGIVTIGDSAFYSCQALTSIYIPDSVLAIGDNAFYYCKSLSSITIPDSVVSISDSAFKSCSALNCIIVNPNSYAEQFCKSMRIPYSYPAN